MLQKFVFLFSFLSLAYASNSFSSPVLEFLGSRDDISNEERIATVAPVQVDSLLNSRENLKDFLKRYGTLRLNFFTNENPCNQGHDLITSFVEHDEIVVEGAPETNNNTIYQEIEAPKTNLLDDFEIPESIGAELVILENSHVGEYIKFGLWSNNLKTWNIFKLNLHTYKTDSLSTDIFIDKDQAKAEIRYQYRMGSRDTIELKFYNQLRHDILSPTKLQSGGQIQYKFRVGKFNFGFYFFGSHELDL